MPKCHKGNCAVLDREASPRYSENLEGQMMIKLAQNQAKQDEHGNIKPNQLKQLSFI